MNTVHNSPHKIVVNEYGSNTNTLGLYFIVYLIYVLLC